MNRFFGVLSPFFRYPNIPLLEKGVKKEVATKT
jgi:hypothetical protein